MVERLDLKLMKLFSSWDSRGSCYYSEYGPLSRHERHSTMLEEGGALLGNQIKAEMHQSVIEVGTDLVAWPSPSPYAIPDIAATNTPGVSVQKGVPTGFDTITLTLPQGLDSRKFARLKVTIAP